VVAGTKTRTETTGTETTGTTDTMVVAEADTTDKIEEEAIKEIEMVVAATEVVVEASATSQASHSSPCVLTQRKLESKSRASLPTSSG
jgi:hypothetical protein